MHGAAEQSAWHSSPSLRLMLCLSPSMSRTTHPSPGATGGARACDSFKSPQPVRRTSPVHLIELRHIPPPTCVTGTGYCDQSRNQDGEARGRQGDRKSLFIESCRDGRPGQLQLEMTCLLAPNKNRLAKAWHFRKAAVFGIIGWVARGVDAGTLYYSCFWSHIPWNRVKRKMIKSL